MYNEDRKRKYMDTLQYKADVYYMKKAFDASAILEPALQKDLCEFDKPTMLVLFKGMKLAQLTTAQGCYTAIRKYCRWCMEENYISKRDLVPITKEEMMERLRQLPEIITYEELQRNENLLINVCDQLILEAIYLGIRGKDYCELMEMSEKNINVIDRTILLCTGRTIPVTNRFIALCRASAGCYEYYLTDRRRQELTGSLPIKRNVQVKNADSEAKESANSKMIGSRLNRFKKLPGYRENLGTTMLFDSGFVNTCKAAMEEKEMHDFEQFMNTADGQKIYAQYGMPLKSKWNKIRKYQGYFE